MGVLLKEFFEIDLVLKGHTLQIPHDLLRVVHLQRQRQHGLIEVRLIHPVLELILRDISIGLKVEELEKLLDIFLTNPDLTGKGVELRLRDLVFLEDVGKNLIGAVRPLALYVVLQHGEELNLLIVEVELFLLGLHLFLRPHLLQLQRLR